MKEIINYTAEISTQGNGYLSLKVKGENDATEEVNGIAFNSVENFAAVCSMLNHVKVFYLLDESNQHIFISEK